MKKMYFVLIVFLLIPMMISCNSDKFKYDDSAQDMIDWLYINFGDNNNFEVLGMEVTDDQSDYIYYSVDFQMEYNTYTEEGIITSQGTMMYFVFRTNPTIFVRFNVNDSSLHKDLYDAYLLAVENGDAYTKTYSADEIEDMLQTASDNH